MKKYLEKIELKKLGFLKVGENNKISRSLKTFNLKGILGSNNRIDEDVILKGSINLKDNIHIAKGCTLSGDKKGIEINNFVSLSNYVQVFCISDDYKAPCLSGGTLTASQRKKYSKIIEGKVDIKEGCIIGPFSIILPDTKIESYASFSPMSIIFGKFKKGFFYDLKKK